MCELSEGSADSLGNCRLKIKINNTFFFFVALASIRDTRAATANNETSWKPRLLSVFFARCRRSEWRAFAPASRLLEGSDAKKEGKRPLLPFCPTKKIRNLRIIR